MMKRTFIIICFMLSCFFKLFSQNVLLQDFTCKDFELQYPKKWVVDTLENQIAFYYNANLGEMRISVFESQNLSEQELKQTITDAKEVKEANPNIQSTKTDGQLRIDYQFTEDGFVNYFRMIQNEKKMYFIILYWKEDSWNDFKDLLLESYNSIKVK